MHDVDVVGWLITRMYCDETAVWILDRLSCLRGTGVGLSSASATLCWTWVKNPHVYCNGVVLYGIIAQFTVSMYRRKLLTVVTVGWLMWCTYPLCAWHAASLRRDTFLTLSNIAGGHVHVTIGSWISRLQPQWALQSRVLQGIVWSVNELLSWSRGSVVWFAWKGWLASIDSCI